MTTEELQLLLGTAAKSRNAAEWAQHRETMRQKGLDPSNFYQEVEMSSP